MAGEIKMIDYTIKVEKTFKIAIPAFVVEWDAVYEHALAALYKMKPIDKEDLSCIKTEEYVEYPRLN